MGRAARRAGAMIAHVWIKTSEYHGAHGAPNAPSDFQSPCRHSNTPSRRPAGRGRRSEGRCRSSRANLGQPLRPGAEIGPLEFAEARKPPALPGCQEEVIDAIPVEVTDAVLSQGVEAEYIVGSDIDGICDVIAGSRVAILGNCIGATFMLENIAVDNRLISRISTDLDGFTTSIEDGITLDYHCFTRCSATPIGGGRPTVLVAVHINLVGLPTYDVAGPPATRKNQVLPRRVAGVVFLEIATAAGDSMGDSHQTHCVRSRHTRRSPRSHRNQDRRGGCDAGNCS